MVVRIMPVVLVKNGSVVLSRNFSRFQNQGLPTPIIDRLCSWDSDEIVILDISRKIEFETEGKARKDTPISFSSNLVEITKMCSKFSSTPLSVGGGIVNLSQIETLLKSGSDKVVLNSSLYLDSEFCQRAINEFGGSTLVASIDYRCLENIPTVFVKQGSLSTSMALVEYCKFFDSWGFSEFIVNSIDRDGSGSGFDLHTGEELCRNLTTPVVICGGAGRPSHFEEAIGITGISGVAAANYFYFQENSMLKLKGGLKSRSVHVREPQLANEKVKKET